MKTMVVLFPMEETANKIVSLLRGLHMGDVVKATDFPHALRLMYTRKNGGVFITGHRPMGMSFEGMLNRLPNWFDMLLVVTGPHLVRGKYHNLLHLPPPIKLSQLRWALRLLTVTPAEKYSAIGKDVKEIELVNSAKDRLIRTFLLTEEQAHRFLQQKAMKFRLKRDVYAKYVCDTIS